MSSSLLADLTRAITINGVTLNPATLTAGGILVGCAVDSLDLSVVQIRQFTEPLALAQGLDVGGVWLGGRTIKMTGTYYAATRGAAFDGIATLEAAMDPSAIYAGTPSTFGYVPMTWYAIQTGGSVVLRTLYVRPDGLLVTSKREFFGGADGSPLGIPWSMTGLAKNPVVA